MWLMKKICCLWKKNEKKKVYWNNNIEKYIIFFKNQRRRELCKGGEIINVLISPFHLLCIFKEFGEGIDLFHPDLKSQNNYYFLANAIIFKDVDHVNFTIGCDEVCNSCVYLKNDNCIDKLVENKNYLNINDYYININNYLFSIMKINDNNSYDMKHILNLINNIISIEIVNKCWIYNSQIENEMILSYIKNGLMKLLKRYTQ